MMSALLAESQRRLTLIESAVAHEEQLPDDEARAAVDYVLGHPDFTSYRLLFAFDRSLYESIPAAIRAEVLCSALANVVYLNDWGHLAVAPREGPAMRALVSTGEVALPCLKPLLKDRRAAPFFGSADATVATQYRRADFAYHAASLILHEKPVFAALPEDRDRDIETLAGRLR